MAAQNQIALRLVPQTLRPDNAVPTANHRRIAAALQLLQWKRQPKDWDRPSAAQLVTIAAIQAAGAFFCIAEGLDRVLAALEAWRLLCGQGSITAHNPVSR